MLKVFLSSTFRDLGAERAKILVELDNALEYIGMENFIPDGSTSQEVAINRLKESDIVIFLVTPWYGSLLEKCDIADCAEKCVISDDEKISYTHCEYKVAKRENKPHQTYIINQKWDLIDKLSAIDNFNWENAWDDPIFEGVSRREIQHYQEISKKALEFRSEAEEEYSRPINEEIDVKTITSNLSCKIIDWYCEGRISFKDMCGRKEQLKNLMDKMGEGVEVYGAGGIGKTTLIHLALLIQKLKGKKIIAIGTRQSYSLGSGYKYFINKCKKDQYEIAGNSITLDNIIDTLSLPEDIKTIDTTNKIKEISSIISNENTILFIDDFHLADNDVQSLVRYVGRNLILASKRKVDITRNELYLPGIYPEDRDALIDTICRRLNKTIGNIARERIKKIAEGHPVSTELLVRNSERINFDKLETYKQGLNLSRSDHAEEFIKRVIEDALSETSFILLRNLSNLNTDIESNLDVEAIRNIDPENFPQIMAEFIDTGMLRKKEDSENIYQFTYHHIKEVLADNDMERHKWALYYYEYKNNKSVEDEVEILYHQSMLKSNKNVVDNFIALSSKIKPTGKGFSRLIDVGILLKDRLPSKQKAKILLKLGYLCGNLYRVNDCLEYTLEAKTIYTKFLKRDNKNFYKSELALIWSYLGNAYKTLKKYEEAENAYNKSLFIGNQIPTKDPKRPHYLSATTHMNKGNLYTFMNRFDDALMEYDKSLEIRLLFDMDNLMNFIGIQRTTICLSVLYIKNGMIEDGIYNIKTILDKHKTILPPDLSGYSYQSLGEAYEKENNPREAARNYMYSIANYFICLQKGAFVFYLVEKLLENVKNLGDEETKGEAIIIKLAIAKLAGRNIEIPKDICISTRIEPLKEALNGNRKNFLPNNEIESMIKELSDELLSR